MAKEAVFQLRMDAETKERVERLYLKMGTTFAEAVRMFAAQSLLEQGMPFRPSVLSAKVEKDAEETGIERAMRSAPDELLEEAVELVLSAGQVSLSMLQRCMRIGYARAGRLIDEMAARGIVSEFHGTKPREVLMNREEYEAVKELLLS